MRWFSILIFSFILMGCVSLTQRTVDDIPYTLHINDPAAPCHGKTVGCFVEINEENHIYVAEDAPEWVLSHEIDHVRGMRHSNWRTTVYGWCAFIIRSGGKYNRGDLVCRTEEKEYIIKLEDQKWK